MKTSINFLSHLAQFFLEWEMFQKKVVEKVKPHILFWTTFCFRKLRRLWDIWKNRLFSSYQLNAYFLYSVTLYMLYSYYNPQHVSSSILLIFRRTNCIITASGIVTLEIGERSYINKMRSAVFLKQYWNKNNLK